MISIRRLMLLLFLLNCNGILLGQVPLFEENFNFTSLDLAGQNGWTIVGTATSNHISVSDGTGLTYAGYACSGIGNAAYLSPVSGDNVQCKSFSAVNAGNIYAAMLVKVVSASANGDYFYSFFDNNTYRARFYAKSSGTGFQFGLSKGTGNIVYTNQTPFSFNQTYLVMIRYQFVGIKAADDSISLYVNPEIGNINPLPVIPAFVDTTQSDLAQIGRLIFRERSSDAAGVYVDGIRVGREISTVLAQPGSMSSDIISAGDESVNINYIKYQADTVSSGRGLKLWSFTARDGGTQPDSDSNPTLISGLVISKGANNSTGDWSTIIRKAALYYDTVKIADASSITQSSISFNGLTGQWMTINDNTSRTFSLLVTFKPNVIDNEQFQFKISPGSVSGNSGSSSYSGFGTFPDAQSSIDGDKNRIEVTADRLVFAQQPTDAGVNGIINPPVIVTNCDSLLNTDKDCSDTIIVTGIGGQLNGSPVKIKAVQGAAQFSALSFPAAVSNVRLQAVNTANNSLVISEPFNIITGTVISVGTVGAFEAQVVNTISAVKSYTVSAAGLTQDLLITPPESFQISLSSGSGFVDSSGSLTLTQSNGAIPPTNIYVRFAPITASGTISASIRHTGGGSIVKNVTVSGRSLAVEPGISSLISFSSITASSIVVGLNGGNGQRRILICRAGSPVSYVPVDGDSLTVTANTNFSSAPDIGGGNKLLLNGQGRTVQITGLTNMTKYYFTVFEYNSGTGDSHNYLTSSPGTGSQTAASRYLAEIFQTYNLTSDIQFGTSATLKLDTYMPAGDTLTKRPLVIFIHGGGFKDGDKVSNFGTLVCGGLAKRGYAVASINYRLSASTATDKDHFEAMIKALQDAKASVRFFRKNAQLYGIDSTQIFVTGSSAGSITALHMAYLQDLEVPSYVDLASLGGNLEGSSGNPGYSSSVQGVISNWGALGDWRWMKSGDVPVYCVHGTSDVTVPYDSSFGDGPFRYGSKIISEYAASLGIRTGLRLFYNTGHTLDNNSAKQDSALKDFSTWLYTILGPSIVSVSERSNKLIPDQASLGPNYPNPFNPSTVITYELDSGCMVVLKVYDIVGKEIGILKQGFQQAGKYSVVFEASRLPSGVYFYSLQTPAKTFVKKMVLLK